jgi:serine/threonine protein kinase
MLREKSSDSDVVLMDFGLAARTGGPTKRTLKDECGTPGYAAPEVLNGGPYGVECDIWAVGVIAFALLGGYPPFHSEDEDEVLTKSANADFSFDPDFWTPITPAAKEFISEALVVSQDKRPTAAQCLTNSSWLSPKYDEVVAQADAKRQKKAKAQTRKSKQALGGSGKPALSSKRGGAAPRKSGGAAVRSSGIKSGGPQNKGSASLRASKVNNALLSGDSSVRSLSPASTASTRA